MLKTILFLFLFFFGKKIIGQNVQDWYVAYSTGINMRKTPSLKGELIGKIPYSTKLKIDNSKKDTSIINVEGLNAYWVPVFFNNKNGWVLDCYLISLIPPKKGTKKMENYLLQLSSKYGKPLQKNTGSLNNITENGNKQSKQLYNNGAQHNTYIGYEYNSDTYFLPNVTMQEAFLILRQIEEYSELFSEKSDYPIESKKIKKKLNDNEIEFNYKITKEVYGNYNWLKKIEIEYENGAYYNFSMYPLENDVVIFLGSGV